MSLDMRPLNPDTVYPLKNLNPGQLRPHIWTPDPAAEYDEEHTRNQLPTFGQ